MSQACTFLNLNKGEPDFHTPDHIKEAACAAIRENFTKYTPTQGISELREAVAQKFLHENGFTVHPDQVVISCGAKHSLYNIFLTLIRPGDEVLIPVPIWLNYAQQIEQAGGRPVLIPAPEAEGFRPDPDRLRRAITPATRMIVYCSPANPTGAVYEEALLREIAEIALAHNLTIVADEVYERLLYDGARHVSIASLDPAVAKRCITVNSVSKTHAMTGYRIGYAAMPPDLAREVTQLQGISTSAPSAIGQRAALAALTGDQSHVERMRQAYAERRAEISQRLARHPLLSASRPLGAFYFFMNVSALYGLKLRGRRIVDCESLVKLLAEEANVNVGDGDSFGSADHIRISHAISSHDLFEGLDRIEALLHELD